MAADVRMRPATLADGRVLAERLRPVEADEVRAATGREPLPVIMDSIETSEEAWSVYFNGELAFIWGVVDLHMPGNVGAAWMLTTLLVEKYAKTFWKLALRLLPDLLGRWGELVNAIDARHEQALRWARRLGFRFSAPIPYGDAGLEFHPFRVAKGDLCVSR